jgi:hypothetical protein
MSNIDPRSIATLEGDLVSAERQLIAELRERYRGHPAYRRTLWSETFVAREVDLVNFRADNAYVWQRGYHDDAYRHSYRWLKRSENELLSHCFEDGAFGAKTVTVGGRLVSRDLLDSVAELGFLVKEFGNLAGLATLDIGAGYGRLAHRASEVLPLLTYICTDGVPESTFLCRKYLTHRDANAKVVPLDEIEGFLEHHPIDLAINVHSFPECSYEVIDWWLRLLAEHDVPFLFLVPNELDEFLTWEQGGKHRDFRGLLESFGYTLEAARLKYPDGPIDAHDWLFQDLHCLFSRSS